MRNKRHQDISLVQYIKDEGDHVLLRAEDIKAGPGKYFYALFNATRGRDIVVEQDDIHLIEADISLSQNITREKVKVALCMMGMGKTVGLDEISIEATTLFYISDDQDVV
ncbi:hypothetical protein POM88_018690 [Heracleum sosnowskyi]|uniref:Uncharacterized protein n=1 Tax=Heracleum sosnowskyi TaxID=360622 RepID=A0AAD8MZJ6_9APIA|nr:hypothetical protein POM88_018690 [Heracleum sosnowskyi]